MATDRLTIKDELCPVDLLLWRHYRREIPGLLEATLAANPGLAELGTYPPVGTVVLVPRPGPLTSAPRPLRTLWTTSS